MTTINTAPTFSQADGKVTTDFGADEWGRSVIQQADGKLVVAGFSSGNDGFALARYNINGTLDASFGGDGTLTTDLGSFFDVGHSVIQQADGKLVMAGYADYDFVLVRYNLDGTLDASFSGDGKLTTDVGAYDRNGTVIQQADGKLVVAGSDDVDSGFALVRYDLDGTLDTSFSGDGKLITDMGASAQAQSVIQQADGKLVIAGTSNSDFALVRYNLDGTLDPNFGSAGKLTTDLGVSSYDDSRCVIQQADGKLVVAGTSNSDFALVRYNTDGMLDTSFGSDGKITTDLGASSYDAAYSVIQQADGKLVVVGTSDSDFALARYNTDGTLDTSFSGDGKLTTDFSSSYDDAYSVIQQADSKLVVAGRSGAISNSNDFALARYNVDGSLDTSFGVVTLNNLPTGSVTIIGTPVQGLTLTVSNTLVDVDGLGTISYQWKVNGTVITGATGSTYTLSQADLGKIISVTASYTDGLGTAESVTSAATVAVTLNTITGDSGNNVLLSAAGDDAIDGGAGNDTASYANVSAAVTVSLASRVAQDTEGAGIDTLRSIENLTGSNYDDHLIGNAAANILDGGLGADIMAGRNGNDTYYVNHVDDVVSESLAGGVDTVYSALAAYTLRSNVEKGVVQGTVAGSLTGNVVANTLTGNAVANKLDGGAGNDKLDGKAGNDTLIGDTGNDTLIGGAGKDMLTGGAGNDVFDFNTLAESGITNATRDIITDFTRGQDKIDLSTLDANTTVAGNNAFNSLTVGGTFSGSFASAGDLYFDTVAKVLYGNTDADAAAEFSIQLTGITTLTTADLIL